MSLGLTNIYDEGYQQYPSEVSVTYCLLYIGQQVQAMSLFCYSYYCKTWLIEHNLLSLLPPQCSNTPLGCLSLNEGEYGRISWLAPSTKNHVFQSMLYLLPYFVPYQAQYPIRGWHRITGSFFHQQPNVENRQRFRPLDDRERLNDIWRIQYILSLPLKQYLPLLLEVLADWASAYHGVGDGSSHYLVESHKIWGRLQYHLWLCTKLESWCCNHYTTHIYLDIRIFWVIC